MPLSDDQKAMLRLLAQREQGYDDIAALMGLSVDEVRAKVKDALAQLEDEGAKPPALPVEPLPVEEPRVGEPAKPDPEPETPAAPAAMEPPSAAKVETPAPAAPAATSPVKPKRTPPPRPSVSLPKSGGARAAIAAGALVLVALIVVLAVSGGGSSGSSTTTASGESTTAAAEPSSATAASSKEVTQATLNPVDGGDAKGVATFGRVKNSLALQIEATGLAPTGKGQSYTIWLYDSPQKMLPLATTAVTKSGKIGAQVEVPTEVLAYLAKETFDQIDISLTSDANLKASLNKATKEKKSPAYTGTDVLRGQITGPIIGASR